MIIPKCRFLSKTLVLAILFLVSFFVSVPAVKASIQPLDYFQITGYYGPRWSQTTDEVYNYIKDSGIKWIQNNTDDYTPEDIDTVQKSQTILDMCATKNLKYVVVDSRFKNLATATNAEIDAIANDYKNYSACGGYYIWDEPGATQLTGLANAYNRFLYNDPDAQPLVNLLPVYGGDCGGTTQTSSILQQTTVGGTTDVTTISPLGQTFKTASDLDRRISHIQLSISSSTWAAGENLILTIYDNTSKNQVLGNPVTLTATNNGDYPQFNVNAILTPNTTYYFELTHNGGGDNSITMNRDTFNGYADGSGYVNGSSQSWDFYFKCTFSEIYQDYLEQWVDAVGASNLNYLLYDNYPYKSGQGVGEYGADYFYNAEYVRDMALKKGVRSGAYLQVLGPGNTCVDENQLRWNYYTNLAYGVKSLGCFTLSMINFPQQNHAVLRRDGYKDTLYSYVQNLNSEVTLLGPSLMTLTSQAVYHSGFRPEGTSSVPNDFFWKPRSSNDNVIISYFTNADGIKYIMAVNRSITTSYTYTFDVNPKPDRIYEISKTTGNAISTNYNSSTGVISDTFLPGEGKLYVLCDPGDVPPTPIPTPIVTPTPTPTPNPTPRPDTIIVNNTDPGIKYSGTWYTNSNRGYGDYQDDVKYTSTNNDYFEYTFNGTGVDYITEKEASQGNVDVYIDGMFKQTVSCYNATRLSQQTVFSKTGLPSGLHTIKVVKTSGANCLLDCFRVYTKPIINNTDTGITYSGTWYWDGSRGYGDYQDDVKYANDNGDYCQYTFDGTGIDYVTEKYNTMGNVDIYIDGTFQQTVSCYNATRLAQQTVYSKTGLSPGSHTIKIVKTSGTNILIDTFRVYTGTLVDDVESNFIYSGSWSLSNHRSDYLSEIYYTTNNNDYFQYTFTGTGVDYITEKNSNEGNVDLYIDGVFQQTISCYNATELLQQTVYSITGLTQGTHTIKGVKTSGTYMLVDALRVYNAPMTNNTESGLSYSGTWYTDSSRGLDDYMNDVKYTNTNNDFCEYTFNGTCIDYITEKYTDMGDVDIYIDEVFKGTISCYNATRLSQQVVYNITGLIPGSHTIKVVKKNGMNMLVDAFRVY